MKVYNMVSPRTGEKVANQFIIEDGHTTVFQSYDSTIVTLTDCNGYKTITFGTDWDYSRTTGKYRNAFLAEYAPYFADVKNIRKALADCKKFGQGYRETLNGTVYEIYFEELQ